MFSEMKGYYSPIQQTDPTPTGDGNDVYRIQKADILKTTSRPMIITARGTKQSMSA